MSSTPFKVGDQVRCVDIGHSALRSDVVYTVVELEYDSGDLFLRVTHPGYRASSGGWFAYRFEHVNLTEQQIIEEYSIE